MDVPSSSAGPAPGRPVGRSRRPPARRGRPRRGQEALTRERIVQEAVALAEDQGLDAVTMRGLARRLGVNAMSLYNHIEDREAVLDAMCELVVTRIAMPAISGDFRADLRAVARAFRAAAAAYPRSVPLILTRPLASFAALASVETVLAILRTAGFPPRGAVSALRAALAYLIGTMLRELSSGPAFSGVNLGGVAQRTRALRRSGLPHVAEAAPLLAVCHHDDEFDFGLELLLSAIELALRQRRRAE